MKVNVYVKLDHHAYARSHVAEVTIVEYEHDVAEGLPLLEEDGWIEFVGVEVMGEVADPSRVCRCGYVEPERGGNGQAYH